MTTLSQILNSLEANNTKTAQEAPAQAQGQPAHAARVTQAQQALSSTMQNVKTASQNTAGVDAAAVLQKTAQDLAEAERNALLKEAHLYGAAVADGFITQLSTYGDYAQKIAAYEGQTQHQQRPQQHQQRPQQHQQRPQQHNQVKTAQEDFAEGVHEGLVKVAAISMDCFERGFQQTIDLLNSARG